MKRILTAIFIGAICTHESFAYYQSEQGRWLSRDPISELGGYNLYAFSLNNPANVLDLLGLISPEEVNRIRGEEGFRSDVYKDTEGNSTIGYGFNLDRGGADAYLSQFGLDYNALLNGQASLTKEDAQKILEKDLANAEAMAQKNLGSDCWEKMDAEVKDIATHMAYQMGSISQFKNMISALCDGDCPDHQKAADEMLDSKWAKQTPERAKGLAERMRNIGSN